jgi:hypothetical protein
MDGHGLPDVLIEEGPHLGLAAMLELISAVAQAGFRAESISEQVRLGPEGWALRLHWLGLEGDTFGVGRLLAASARWARTYYRLMDAPGPKAVRLYGPHGEELDTMPLEEMPA